MKNARNVLRWNMPKIPKNLIHSAKKYINDLRKLIYILSKSLTNPILYKHPKALQLYIAAYLVVCVQYNIFVTILYYLSIVYMIAKSSVLLSSISRAVLLVLYCTLILLFVFPVVMTSWSHIIFSMHDYVCTKDSIPTMCLFDFGGMAESYSENFWWSDYSLLYILKTVVWGLEDKYKGNKIACFLLKGYHGISYYVAYVTYTWFEKRVLGSCILMFCKRNFYSLCVLNIFLLFLLHKVIWIALTLCITCTPNPGKSFSFCISRHRGVSLITHDRFNYTTRRLPTFHTRIMDNYGVLVKPRHYIKEVDENDHSLLKAGYKIGDKVKFSSREFKTSYKVSHRVVPEADFGVHKDQWAQILTHKDAILERTRTLEFLYPEDQKTRDSINKNIELNLLELKEIMGKEDL